MALDRFVKFHTPRFPTREETETVVRNFFAEAGEVAWSPTNDRLFVSLPGCCSSPFKGIEGAPRDRFEDEKRERWIEVYYDKEVPYIDVITRGHDRYTNILAHELAAMFAQFWEGELED